MPDSALSCPILVRGLDDALTAGAAAGGLRVPLALMGQGVGGPLWLLGLLARVRREFPELAATALLDCSDRAGAAQGALAAGMPALLFTGRPDVAQRLAAIASRRGAVVLTRCPYFLDMAAAGRPDLRCREWLSRHCRNGSD
ncbi:hypothetical protein [Azospirillum picis]|uniref:Uncharacterized protein n=1 Tax=Azospirillum picis TaxID=488438 RepID=A0ABU0MEN9_9PROT|nr:hypothetical protein [Azospirillum picis]MBP2298067.1 hypothetical protein [Azospirillum picis]MDQ0531905.1 hypothetical protein [Azospirillum picis]